MIRDNSIDFVKGISIVLVITLHSVSSVVQKLPGILIIKQGVPLFLIVSSYLYFNRKKDKQVEYYKIEDFFNIFRRIFFPFFIFQIPIFIISYIRGEIDLLNIIFRGGIGMGSYYPWVYFQFWLLLPCFLYLIRNKNLKLSHVVIISILIEIVFNLITTYIFSGERSDLIWRLFVGRYIFIIFIGYLLSENKFDPVKFAPLIFLGVVISLLERYDLLRLSPVSYIPDTLSWKGFHWYLYFYSALLFTVLRVIESNLPSGIVNTVRWLGVNSWEVFLSQMVFFHVFNYKHFSLGNPYISLLLFIVCSLISSILMAIIYKYISTFLNLRVAKRSVTNI